MISINCKSKLTHSKHFSWWLISIYHLCKFLLACYLCLLPCYFFHHLKRKSFLLVVFQTMICYLLFSDAPGSYNYVSFSASPKWVRHTCKGSSWLLVTISLVLILCDVTIFFSHLKHFWFLKYFSSLYLVLLHVLHVTAAVFDSVGEKLVACSCWLHALPIMFDFFLLVF